MKAFVLLMLLWNGNHHEVTSTEFSSKQTCEAGAKAAYEKFSGWGTSVYTVCTEK